MRPRLIDALSQRTRSSIGKTQRARGSRSSRSTYFTTYSPSGGEYLEDWTPTPLPRYTRYSVPQLIVLTAWISLVARLLFVVGIHSMSIFSPQYKKVPDQ